MNKAAPIYRCDSKAKKPARPHENHDLCMECRIYMDRELTKAAVTVIRSSCMWIIQESSTTLIMYILSVVRLRIEPAVTPYELMDRCTLNDNSCFTLVQSNRISSSLMGHAHMAHTHTSKDHHVLIPFLDHQDPFQPFHNDTFRYQ